MADNRDFLGGHRLGRTKPSSDHFSGYAAVGHERLGRPLPPNPAATASAPDITDEDLEFERRLLGDRAPVPRPVAPVALAEPEPPPASWGVPGPAGSLPPSGRASASAPASPAAASLSSVSLPKRIGDITGLGVIGQAMHGVDIPTSIDELVPDPNAPLPGAPPPAPPNPAAAWLKTDPGRTFLGGQKMAAAATSTAAPAVHQRAPIRALRMPNGKILYTNQGSYGGPGIEELDYQDAARAERARRATVDPTSRTMSALVRAAAKANMSRSAEGPPGPTLESLPGRPTTGVDPGFDRPGVSFIEGTPQQQLDLDIEAAMGAASLAEAQSAEAFSKKTPDEQARLKNPRIGEMEYLQEQFGRKIKIIEAELQKSLKGVTDPATIKDMRATAAADIKAIHDHMAALQGLRVTE